MSKFSTPFMSKSPLKELTPEERKTLHEHAQKLGEPFFSTKHQVNVDPEDGVLGGRPTWNVDFSKLTENQRGDYTVEELEALYPESEGRKLTYSDQFRALRALRRENLLDYFNPFQTNLNKK